MRGGSGVREPVRVRQDVPRRLRGRYRQDDVAEYAGAAWFRAGESFLDHEEWRDLFELAGYREDDCEARRPTEPLLLWRGATPEHRANWSWTDVRDIAIQFASGWMVQEVIGLVWRAVVEPDRLLAKITLFPKDATSTS